MTIMLENTMPLLRSSLRSIDAHQEKKPKKRVSIQKRPTQVHDADKRHHITQSDYATLWYSKDDLKVFRKQVRSLTLNPALLDETQDCSRGLEAFANGNRIKKHLEHITPVLEKHWRHWESSNDHAQELSDYARSLSQSDVSEAIQRGAQDAIDCMNAICTKVTAQNNYAACASTLPENKAIHAAVTA